MGLIPEQFIDNLLTRSDIVDVIDKRVPLKKKGHEFMACCPFHSEKTPSFTVSPEKQFYHCFGCGAHGSAIGFLMEYENLTFVESIESLASSAGVEVPRDDAGNAPRKPRVSKDEMDVLFEATAKTDAWFQKQLREHSDKTRVVDYLKGRGLSGAISKKYGIGFAPDSWDAALNALGKTDSEVQALVEVGVLGKTDKGKIYDRFRNRVQFPIHDFKGRVIGFGGRTLGDDKAKYYNSPETKLFHKGKELYGLYQARNSIKDHNVALVVEGYMDVVALAQFGVDYAVATLGTATTQEHLKRLFRVCDKVVFCFDGDRAGVGAAVKAMHNVLPLMRDGRAAGFMFLPTGEDPDSYIRANGKEKFEVFVQKAKPLETFIFAYLEHQVKESGLDGSAATAKMAEEAKPLLRQLSAGVYFELMLEELSRRTSMTEEKLRRYIETQTDTPVKEPAKPSRRKDAYQIKDAKGAGYKAIALLVSSPKLAKSLVLSPIFFESKRPEIVFLRHLVEMLQKQDIKNTAVLYERLRAMPEASLIQEKIDYSTSFVEEEALQLEFDETMRTLQSQIEKNKRKRQVKNLNSTAELDRLIRQLQPESKPSEE